MKKLFIKVAVAVNSAIFYMKKFFAFEAFYFIYPNLDFSHISSVANIVIFSLLAILIILRGQLLSPHLLFFFCGMFPVLGFFYVPYMSNSYVSDHWAYLGIIGLISSYLLI